MELTVNPANTSSFATYLRGFLDAHNIQVKTVAAKRGLDPSNFSKKTNNRQALSAEEAFLIGVAAGEARAELKGLNLKAA